MTTTRETIVAALSHVPPSNRETWLRMGMAVKSELGEDGFDTWDTWSQRDESYRERDAHNVWRSINPTGKVGIGSLFHEAVKRGYKLDASIAAHAPTADEIAERQAKQREADAEQAKQRAIARTKALATWETASASPAQRDHPYLIRKGVAPVQKLFELPAAKLNALLGYSPRSSGEYLAGRVLVVPVGIPGELHTLELIDEAGRKSALAGGAKAGHYWATQKLRESDGTGKTITIAEGVATALSLYHATGQTAVAALSCTNLAPVAKALRERYPKATLIVCGDIGNGQANAEEAARATGALLALPTFEGKPPEGGSDFNDMLQLRGAEAVKQAIANARAPDIRNPSVPTSNATEAILRGPFSPSTTFQARADSPNGHAPSATTSQARSATSGGFVSTADWPVPENLPAEKPPVDPFAIELLPEALQPWISDVAERVQCPPDFPAVAAMVALGSLLGRKIAVFPKRHDNWHEYANLWGAIVGSPGVLKSPALFEALRPLRELERTANADHADAMKEWREQRIVRQIRVRAGRQNALKAAKKAQDFDVGELGDLDDEDAPALRRYVVNDASVEALGEILRGNPNGTLAYRDELVGLLKQLDREGNEGARSFYLTAWTAKEGHTFDRIGRGLNLRIEGVCLSVLGSIQPSVIGEYLREAATTGGGDGLMSRFSLLTWPEISGAWRNVDRFPDTEARNTAFVTFRAFDQIPGVPEEGNGDAQGLRFDEEAQEHFDDWRKGYEERQRAGEDHPALVAHRNKYRKLVPAVALICHLADEPTAPAIGLKPLLRAEAWVDYLDTHAKRAYSSVMRADADSARELLRRIGRREVADGFRLRDKYRNGWSLLATSEQARRAAQVLVDFDYLRELRDDTGGRPTSIFRINPRAPQ